MSSRTRDDAALTKLEQSTLEELQARYPAEWQTVGTSLVAATQTRRPEALVAFVRKAELAARPWRARLRRSRATAKDLSLALPHLGSARMAKLAADQVLRAAVTQVATGKSPDDGGGRVRLGLWSGALIQRLMFARGLERKPVSLRAFRFCWRFIPDRRLLMPLVQPKGIYCFYSRELIQALVSLVGTRPALEIAAGDGTLARFLAAAGMDIQAVDDQSWGHAITYPTDVERLDAVSALGRHRARVVICSFPPADNPFEQQIFRTPEVELYIVLTTRHRFAAGADRAYQEQRAFERDPERERALSSLLLPPEIDPDVLIFRRR